MANHRSGEIEHSFHCRAFLPVQQRGRSGLSLCIGLRGWQNTISFFVWRMNSGAMLSRRVRTSSTSDQSRRWALHKELQTLCYPLLIVPFRTCACPNHWLSIILFLWSLCTDRSTQVQNYWYLEEYSIIVSCPPVTFLEMKRMTVAFLYLQDF